MNLPGEPAPDHPSADPKPAAGPADRRRIDEIFGDVFPDVTRDERDAERPVDRGAGDRWYLDNRPPHHD